VISSDSGIAYLRRRAQKIPASSAKVNPGHMYCSSIGNVARIGPNLNKCKNRRGAKVAALYEVDLAIVYEWSSIEENSEHFSERLRRAKETIILHRHPVSCKPRRFRSGNEERLDFVRVSSGSRPDRKSTTWITPAATLGLRMSCSKNGGKFRLKCFERSDDKLHAAVPTEQTDWSWKNLMTLTKTRS
jgi:hypothetical protein